MLVSAPFNHEDFFSLILKKYLFTYLWLCRVFVGCMRAFSSCSAWAPCFAGFSCCRVWALERGLSSCGTWV